MGISRRCASKWVTVTASTVTCDYSADPGHRKMPDCHNAKIVAENESMRRTRKRSISGISFETHSDDITIARRTVTKILRKLGLHGRQFLRPERREQSPIAGHRCEATGQMVQVDVKKVGKIPEGGAPVPWLRTGQTIPATHGASEVTSDRLHLQAFRDRRQHSFAYTDARDDETAATAIGFMNKHDSPSPHTASHVSSGELATDDETTALLRET